MPSPTRQARKVGFAQEPYRWGTHSGQNWPIFEISLFPVLPRQGFSLPKYLVMDEGFPAHTVGFMRRKREKEQDLSKRGEQPSQS